MTFNSVVPESQNTEYKSSWQDEYFEWICGFANSKGGNLYIGVNDDGYVVGLQDTRYLLDTLPNQVSSLMGISIEIRHYVVSERGTNIKYSSVPSDVAQKPENLYVRGILLEDAVNEIDLDPNNTQNVSSSVRRLFDVAPGCVKQLRQSQGYRNKLLSDIRGWDKNGLVSLNSENSFEYIVISIGSYDFGISYKGHYFIRSGGTNKELIGIELSQFLMERVGKHWDGMPMPAVKTSDLDSYAIDLYRKKTIIKGRHTPEEVNVSNDQIVSDLKLVAESSNSNRSITRAAVLLFHPDPERFFVGASVKVAFFAPAGAYGANKSDDIIFQDVITGPLMMQADRVVDLVYTKYLRALISYEGLQRIETFMTPRAVFREVILNALNHKSYESCNPIQVSVYEDRIIVFNEGKWPADIELGDIYGEKHSSYPRNPSLSHVFYNAGEIEAYGSGFIKMKIECDRVNAPYPKLSITPNGVTVEIRASKSYMNLLRHGRYWESYPDRAVYLADEDGNHIVTEDGAPIIVETRTKVDDQTIKSVDRMMEILTSSLSEMEKELYLPIVEYLKTHETIKNSDGVKLTGKSGPTVNRYLTRLVELDVLSAEGEKKGRIYRRKNAE